VGRAGRDLAEREFSIDKGIAAHFSNYDKLEVKKMSRLKILTTGATGFVGKVLLSELVAQNFSVSAAVRDDAAIIANGVRKITVGDLTKVSDWQAALQSIDVVIHVAGRAHIMNDNVVDPLTAFREMNTEVTLLLAKQAAEMGVKRFVFVSSVKVNGEMAVLNHPFKPDDGFIPNDPYGLSKYEAEKGLLVLAKETGMDIVIIRPPLVYGAGVRANFASMMTWVNKNIPLPFGSIHNQRSLVALDNLVSFIIHCIDHPKAANEVFLISDGEDVSTTQLLKKVAKAFNKKALLIPVPVSVMTLAAKLIGKADVANRLFGSLQVDSSKARDLLGWKPVTTMDEQLKKIAEAD